MIVDNGYNIGRDYIVRKATKGTHWNSMWWRAEVEWNEDDLLQAGHEGTFQIVGAYRGFLTNL